MNNLKKLNNQVMNEILGIIEEEPKLQEKKKVMALIDFIVITQTIKYSQMKKENSLFLFFPKKMGCSVKNGF